MEDGQPYESYVGQKYTYVSILYAYSECARRNVLA